jgi:hypothetical protein
VGARLHRAAGGIGLPVFQKAGLVVGKALVQCGNCRDSRDHRVPADQHLGRSDSVSEAQISMRPHYYVFVLLLPLPVLAGRPLVTDDARLTEANACQVESWIQRTDAVHEYWMLPACNLFGNFEIAAGGTRFRMDDGNWQSSYLLQGKTLLKHLAPNSYGIGLAFGGLIPDQPTSTGNQEVSSGLLADASAPEDTSDSFYAYVPVSLSLRNDAIVAHCNLGWNWERDNNAHGITWGLAAVTDPTARWSIFAELYGDDRTDPYVHTGTSYELIANRVQLDITFGRQLAGAPDTAFYSLGLNLYFPTFY